MLGSLVAYGDPSSSSEEEPEQQQDKPSTGLLSSLPAPKAGGKRRVGFTVPLSKKDWEGEDKLPDRKWKKLRQREDATLTSMLPPPSTSGERVDGARGGGTMKSGGSLFAGLNLPKRAKPITKPSPTADAGDEDAEDAEDSSSEEEEEEEEDYKHVDKAAANGQQVDEEDGDSFDAGLLLPSLAVYMPGASSASTTSTSLSAASSTAASLPTMPVGASPAPGPSMPSKMDRSQWYAEVPDSMPATRSSAPDLDGTDALVQARYADPYAPHPAMSGASSTPSVAMHAAGAGELDQDPNVWMDQHAVPAWERDTGAQMVEIDQGEVLKDQKWYQQEMGHLALSRNVAKAPHGRLARYKHQLDTLAFEAAANKDLLQYQKAVQRRNKREAKAKYGW